MKAVTIYGAGTIGKTLAYQLLRRAIPVRLFTDKDAPIADKGVGIMERQGTSVTIESPGKSQVVDSILLENESFVQFQDLLHHSWVNFCPVEYHRESMCDDPFIAPFPGMEAQMLSAEELKPGFNCGFRFNGFVVDLATYSDFLLEQILKSPHLVEYRDDVSLADPGHAEGDIVVICCGYGQKKWDASIYPILGETLIVDAPNAPRDKVIGAVMNNGSGNAVPIPGSNSRFLLGATKRSGVESAGDDSHHKMVFALACRVLEELKDAKIISQRECKRIASDLGALIRQWFVDERMFIEVGRLAGFGWTLSWGIVNLILLPMLVRELNKRC